ncbi:glycoprotein-N-acetylgalactosamine 3-beta-galactosyltransferase 1 [Lingula anatina]|uniref:N-acetylgalactosaminide beta-1,3-galactosyltransferase n=1 Tax=Lingula anatina TaxID=7574 RepID=A0A1S3KGT6_LINAN|nr:glycoprotein-N-acetylgalactosamine 3-beta-galactosyltransferase 1 [Lingula anatina]|eukprot:XP_013421855.1 glycoprotein-N-acetylgalactosamine 3-beta-galactosyltransferase 1 [Lingula anatina]
MPRVLCWLLTDPPDLDKRVIHVRDTWARRCDVTLFMSSMENKTFPTIGLRVPPGRGHIAKKAKAAWKYIYEHHLNDADFFIKADPDTYVIVENLKHCLSSRDPKRAEFYGHQFYPSDWEFNADTRIKKSVYMSGGPGFVLSREAVRLLVTKAINSDPKCLQDGEAEDMKAAKCLLSVGAEPVDTRDQLGRERYMIFPPYVHLKGHYADWYKKGGAHGAVEVCRMKSTTADLKIYNYIFYLDWALKIRWQTKGVVLTATASSIPTPSELTTDVLLQIQIIQPLLDMPMKTYY